MSRGNTAAKTQSKALTEHPSWVLGANLLTFVAAWLVMTIAMMLPTALPLIQLFAKLKREQNAQDWQPLLLLFMSAYLAVWLVFALLTFLGDCWLHPLVDSWPWLIQHFFVVRWNHTRPGRHVSIQRP
jgi:predicted metal-binding membrane protein